ncbi:hypothetical protein GCM10028808_70980 [Spirosoma migulaei]
MGSTGSGNFSDYTSRVSGSNDGNSGGSSGEDKCGQAFSASIEEISRCFYFMNYGVVPTIGTEVSISFNGVRLVAETNLGEDIGYLPTKLNYVKVCMDNGFKYSGLVSRSANTPTPSITVDIIPE